MQPQISTVTTNIVAGAYHDAVKITGSNFQPGDVVNVVGPNGTSVAYYRLSFGYVGTNVPLPGLYSNSTEIDFALNAPAAGTYSVEVDSPDGTMKANASFTATQQTTPQIATLTGLNADYFSSDNINQMMVVHGTNFQSGACLEFAAQTNANDQTYRVIPTFVSSTELDYTFNAATMPGIPNYSAGTVPASDTWTVDVLNPGGGFSDISNSLTFHTNPGSDPNPYQRITVASGGVTFNLDFVKADQPTTAFEQAVESAASIVSSAIHDSITLNIIVDNLGTGNSYGGSDNGQSVAYSTIANYLTAQGEPGAGSLPSGTTFNGQSSFYVANAQLKAMGLLSPQDAKTDDGKITIATDAPAADLVALAIHELTHAMGRTTGDGPFSFYDINPFTNHHAFSLDGQTVLAWYGANDGADFLNGYPYAGDDLSTLTPEDVFDYGTDPSTNQYLSTIDLEQMGAIGFDTSKTTNPDVVTETAPSSIFTTVGQSFRFTGSSAVQVVDAGAKSDTMTTTVTATSGGKISVSANGGATVSGSGTTSLTITGTLSQVDATLSTLAYTNSAAGSDTVSVATTDSVNQSSATRAISVTQFDTRPYVLTVTGGSFSYNSSSNQMAGNGTVNIALSATPSAPLVTAQGASATYDNSKFSASGTFYEDVSGHGYALFQGTLALPYTGSSTSKLTDSGPFAGKFDLGGLAVTFNQLTFETGAVLAGFSVALTLPGSSSSITLTSPAGINYGLLFNSSGVQLNFGGTLALPNVAPANVFGLFTGSLTNASLSYLAASDTLQLQGTFTASQILGSALQATVNFSGNNSIQYQNGTPFFNGSLTITGLSGSPAGFGINEIDLSVNTRAQTFSGALAFTMPFGASVTKDEVTLEGSWSAHGPVINSVGVSFSGLSIPVPLEPALIWTSASVSVTNMFTPKTPTTFSGSLGFSFGPQLAGNSVGTLTLQGSGSSQQLTGSANIQLVPYSFVSNIAGGSLSGLQSIFPLLSSTDQVTVNFANSSFENFLFSGTTSILGNFITTSQSFRADADLDFTIAGNATVNFANSALAKLINTVGLSFGASETTNYLVKYSASAALSADYAAAWFQDTVSFAGRSVNFTLGVEATFGGTVSVLYAAPTGGAAATPAAAGQTAQPAISAVDTYLFLTASWTNAATQPVTVTVTDPNGNVIPQANFAANGIAVVSALTTSYQETLAVQDPVATAGWHVSVSSASSLGTVTVTTSLPDATPTISGLSFGSLGANGNLSFQYTVANAGSSTVSLYADQDGINFDGVLLGQSTGLSNGSNSTTVNLNTLGAGQWHFYALISDGISAPGEIYAPGTLAISAPTITVTSDPSARAGQTLALSSLVAVNDPAGVGYQQLQLWDSNGTAAGGQFVINGLSQSGGHEIDLGPADAATTVFQVGTAVGTDTIWARLLENNGVTTDWQAFTVGVTAPTLNVTSINAGKGQVVNLSNLVTISDPGHLGYQKLELWDSNGTAAGGQFVVNGAPQTGGHEIDVTPANVGTTVFDVGTAGGTDTLWAQLLQNDGSVTGWQKFTVAVSAPTLSVTSNAAALKGQVLNLSTLVS
ncbi:hypothetical protein XH88_05255, partial [Bradyrhizobium sp. CCBAU 51627]|nr:hypothetical protein [Bradyrhizobium sp. CCBAU 51627]